MFFVVELEPFGSVRSANVTPQTKLFHERVKLNSLRGSYLLACVLSAICPPPMCEISAVLQRSRSNYLSTEWTENARQKLRPWQG